MTLATQVLIGLLLGVAVGIFFGEESSVLEPADAATFLQILVLLVVVAVVAHVVPLLRALRVDPATVLRND